MSVLRPGHLLARDVTPSSRGNYRVGFRGLALAVGLLAITKRTIPVEEMFEPLLLLSAALLPGYIWMRQPSRYGLPMFPLWSLTLVVTYGLPFLSPTGAMNGYSATARAEAALMVAACLGVATLFWVWFSRRLPHRHTITTPNVAAIDRIFFAALWLGPAFSLLNQYGALLQLGNYSSVFRAVSLSVQALATFYMGCRIASGWGSGAQRALVGILIAAYCFIQATSLLLVTAMITLAFFCIGFFLGAGRPPWRVLILALPIFAFLHLGKGEIRMKCSTQPENCVAGISDYGSLFSDWIEQSLGQLSGREAASSEQSSLLSIFDRASLAQLFLLVHSRSPERVPYLEGESYAVIPSLMIPRFINPDRAWTHEGTYLLNIHYGIQTREETYTTTIGWGLLNEAYANYGAVGLLTFGALLGAALGAVAAWAKGEPLYSLRSMSCLLLIANLVNTEASAGIVVTAMAQSLAGLLLLWYFIQSHARSVNRQTIRAHYP